MVLRNHLSLNENTLFCSRFDGPCFFVGDGSYLISHSEEYGRVQSPGFSGVDNGERVRMAGRRYRVSERHESEGSRRR